MLDMVVTWKLNLDSIQLNMVLRALRGAMRPGEAEDSNELANQLASAKISLTRNRLGEVEKLENNINKDV